VWKKRKVVHEKGVLVLGFGRIGSRQQLLQQLQNDEEALNVHALSHWYLDPSVFHRLLPILAVCGVLVAARAEAQTQVSGSMPIQPNVGQSPPSDVLHENQSVTMDIFLCNTSTFNGAAADTRVTGTTRIAMACSDTTCIAQDGSTNAATEGAQLTFDSCVGRHRRQLH